MRTNRHFLLSISLVAILVSCNNNKGTNIALLHTNDVHGKLRNFDKLAYLKDSLLTIYDTVLLISAGDMFSGNPYVDFYDDKGYPIVDLMNKVGYDLAALGNHEFDYGQEILAKRIEQAEFPIIIENIFTDKSLLEEFNPSYSLYYNNIHIEFKSLLETQENGLPSTHPDKVENLGFIDPLMVAQELFIKQNKNDVLIGLTHLGFDLDSLIASQNTNLDIIIGGHSHTLIDSIRLINNILVAQAGENLEHVGLIELSFKGNKLTNRNYKLLPFNELKGSSSEIKKLIENYSKNEYLEEVIATNQTVMDRNSLGCFFTDAQLFMHKLDFAFQNYWGIRVNTLEKGNISRLDVFEIDPFNNELLIYSMNEKELKSLLKSTYSTSGYFDLYIAGGTYTIMCTTDNIVKDITILDKAGKPLDKNKYYQVGLNSYIARTYQLNCVDSGKSSNTLTSDNIIKYLKQVEKINYSNSNRVTIEKK